MWRHLLLTNITYSFLSFQCRFLIKQCGAITTAVSWRAVVVPHESVLTLNIHSSNSERPLCDSRQLSKEQQDMKAALERQAGINQKLSQEKEQLMFKLRHRDSCPTIHLPAMVQEITPRWLWSHDLNMAPVLDRNQTDCRAARSEVGLVYHSVTGPRLGSTTDWRATSSIVQNSTIRLISLQLLWLMF